MRNVSPLIRHSRGLQHPRKRVGNPAPLLESHWVPAFAGTTA